MFFRKNHRPTSTKAPAEAPGQIAVLELQGRVMALEAICMALIRQHNGRTRKRIHGLFMLATGVPLDKLTGYTEEERQLVQDAFLHTLHGIDRFTADAPR